ncbi:MAG: RsmB/NOP family class I SAM-dependent RNA methyltransferase [Thermoprotei archaeon]|nr:MAG: RsmB/NOP family class I SAM-dependent RNA methyltransferase [Thermoprotei archaeon]
MYPEIAAAIILNRVEIEKRALRDVAMEFFEEHSSLDYLKPIVRVLTLNTLRNYMFIDYLLEITGYRGGYRGMKKWLLRIITYELISGKKPKLSRINKIIDKLSLSSSFVNDIKSLDPESIRRKLVKVNRIDIAYSMPKWIVSLLRKARIPNLEKFLESLLRDPVTWIRASTHRINVDALSKLLSNEGFSVKKDNVLPDCLKVLKGDRGKLAKVKLYELGYYVIQDKASILVGHIVKPEDKVVLDLTCGAGLKTTHFAQLGAKKVIAQDILYNKLVDASNLASRLGLDNKILFIVADSSVFIVHRDVKDVDIFVIDPPCSGIGRMALQPELKIHLTPNDIKRYTRLQYRLLESVIKRARRGAKILYSTCTVTIEENEDLVKFFEKEGFVEILDQKPFIGSKSFYDPRIQRLYPHLHGTQGFTITYMEAI